MVEQNRLPSGYLPLEAELLQCETIVDFDIFLWQSTSPNPVLYRNKNLPFLEDQMERLSDIGDATLLIRKEQGAAVSRYVERNLDRIIASETLPTKTKAKILYSTSLNLAREIMDNPGAPQNTERAEDVVRSTIAYVLKGKEAFQSLMAITSYDYYTYTHSVNVCTIGVALAEKVGLRSQGELMEFGIGALFHDVGKTRIAPGVLRKRGPLTDEEWIQMRQHPAIGLELVGSNAELGDNSKAVILEHHERLDGKGYPEGKAGDAIHPFAKVAGVVDVFDALTTRRSYKDAIDTFAALKIMKEEVGTHFESEIFNEFVRLLGA